VLGVNVLPEFPFTNPTSELLMVPWLPHYERREGALPSEIRAKVLAISAPQIDRLLAPCRARTRRQRLGGTRPGTLLRNQIPVRTGALGDCWPGLSGSRHGGARGRFDQRRLHLELDRDGYLQRLDRAAGALQQRGARSLRADRGG
jgi:hypothetical protein